MNNYKSLYYYYSLQYSR